MFPNHIKEKYNSKILDERVYPETLISTIILSDLTVLDDFNLKQSDFLSIEYSILFRIAKEYKEQGYLSVSQVEAKSKLKEDERIFFGNNGIWKVWSESEKIAKKDNFINYIDMLYKNNIYIKLADIGVDVLNPIQSGNKTIIPFEKFRNFTSEEVKNYYDDLINEFSTIDTNKGIEETVVGFSDSYMKSIEEGQLIGTMFDKSGKDIKGNDIVAFPTLSKESNGILNGTLSMLAGYSNVGKSTFLISFIMSLVDKGEKVVICSNEQKSEPFITNFLMWILVHKLGYKDLPKYKLRKGLKGFTSADKAMLTKAKEIWDNEYLGKIMFISIPSARIDVVQKKFREYKLKNSCTVFIYDTFKVDFTGNGETYWLSLIQDSRVLAEFANKYNVKVFATMQNAIHTQGKLWLTGEVLSGSKQVKEILQNLFLIRDMYQEEKDPTTKFYCQPYTLTESESMLARNEREMIPYSLNPNKSYKIIFIDKTRDGVTSEQGSYAVVVEFDGAYGLMKEVCLCKPKRLNISGSQKGNSGK